MSRKQASAEFKDRVATVAKAVAVVIDMAYTYGKHVGGAKDPKEAKTAMKFGGKSINKETFSRYKKSAIFHVKDLYSAHKKNLSTKRERVTSIQSLKKATQSWVQFVNALNDPAADYTVITRRGLTHNSLHLRIFHRYIRNSNIAVENVPVSAGGRTEKVYELTGPLAAFVRAAGIDTANQKYFVKVGGKVWFRFIALSHFGSFCGEGDGGANPADIEAVTRLATTLRGLKERSQ